MARPTITQRLTYLVVLAATVSLPSGAALAQTTTDTTASSVTWSDLSPGNDWTASVLNSIFPVTGGSATATGTMLQYISAYAMLIAAFWISYASILQVHRTAESGKILSTHFSGWVPVRIIMALILMIPVSGGYSAGQALVVQAADTAIGMARNLTDVVADAIGPQALPIANPIVPGTRRVVMSIMESELCSALINQASGDSSLVTLPAAPAAAPGTSGPPFILNYALASGDSDGAPTCGSVTLQTSQAAQQQILGDNINLQSMTNAQVAALGAVITAVRQPMTTLAQTLWTNRNTTALTTMDSVLSSASSAYAASLASAASSAVSTIRNDYSSGASATSDPGYVALTSLGWSGLGAYYLEIARVNGEVLSMISIVPSVTLPNWQGLGRYLTKDIAPLLSAIKQYQNAEEAQISATDTSVAPDGAPGLFQDAKVPGTASSVLDRVTRSMGLTNAVLTGILNIMLAPTSGSSWTDPLAAMIGVGHLLIHTALVIIGGAALLSTKTGGILATIGNAIDLNIPGFIASATATIMSGVIKALLSVIFGGASLLLIPGIMLAYILPMTPYIYWIAGVAGWFLLVVEAVIAVPIWAMAHLVFQGEGLHGRGIRGYEALFSILFRPVMMIAGLLLSYSVFSAMSWLVMKSFTVASGFVLDQGYLTDNWIGLIVLLCMFVTLEMTLAIMCFRLISTLPHHIPVMAGMASLSRVDSDNFADRHTGTGMTRPTHESSELARRAAGSLASGVAQKPLAKPGAKQHENSPNGPTDATTNALLTGAGRQED